MIVCVPAVVSAAAQLAAPALTAAEHNAPCVADVNTTVPVGAVLFTTAVGVIPAVSVTVPPLAAVVADEATVVVVGSVPVEEACVVNVADVLVLKVPSPEYTASNVCAVVDDSVMLVSTAVPPLTAAVDSAVESS